MDLVYVLMDSVHEPRSMFCTLPDFHTWLGTFGLLVIFLDPQPCWAGTQTTPNLEPLMCGYHYPSMPPYSIKLNAPEFLPSLSYHNRVSKSQE